MLEHEADGFICFSGVASEIKGSIYISLLEFNGLIRVDIDTGFVQFIGCFQYECTDYQLHIQMAPYQDKLFCIPWNAANMAIYDVRKNELRYIFLNDNGISERFAAGIQNGRYLYLVSETASSIVQIDMDMERIIDNHVVESSGDSEPFIDYINVRPLKTCDGIWRISEKKDNFWRYNFHDDQYIKLDYALGQYGELIAGCVGKECIWVITDKEMVYQLSKECEYLRCFDISMIMNDIYKDEKKELFDCVFLDGMLFIMFYEKKCIAKIPVIGDSLDVESWQYHKFRNACFSFDDNQLVVMADDRIIYVNDMEEKIIIPNVLQDSLTALVAQKGFLLKEGYCFTKLDKFLQYALNDRMDLSNIDIHKKSAGKKIFDILKGE